MLAMASPYRYRDGLARVGQAWHYRFRLRGTTHQAMHAAPWPDALATQRFPQRHLMRHP